MKRPTFEAAREKLREAEFFVDHLRRGDRIREIGFFAVQCYVSAFLSAARSVEERLKKTGKPGYEKWKKTNILEEDRDLLDAIGKSRDQEVHWYGAPVGAIGEPRPHTELGQGDPRVLKALGPFGEFAFRIDHAFFERGQAVEEVVERCDRVVAVLRRVVREFPESA